jgi:hypothetical protein
MYGVLPPLRHHGMVYGHIFTINLAVTLTEGREGGSAFTEDEINRAQLQWLNLVWTGSVSAFSGCTNEDAGLITRLALAFSRHHVSCPIRCLGTKRPIDKHNYYPPPPTHWRPVFPQTSKRIKTFKKYSY